MSIWIPSARLLLTSLAINDSPHSMPVVVRHGPQTSRHPRHTELGLSHEWTLFAVDSGGTRGGGAGGLYGASDRPGSGRVPPH